MRTLQIIVTDTLIMLGVLVLVAAVITQGVAGLLILAVLAPVAWLAGALTRRVWGLIDAR